MAQNSDVECSNDLIFGRMPVLSAFKSNTENLNYALIQPWQHLPGATQVGAAQGTVWSAQSWSWSAQSSAFCPNTLK